MNTPDEIDEGTLMAYADGELDAEQSVQLEQLLKRDAVAAARVAQHKALRSQLQTEFAAVLSEPIPERLLNAVKRDANNPEGKIVDLSQARRASDVANRWKSREWMAIAASLIMGVMLGVYALKFNPSQLVGEHNGVLIAQGNLERALTTQLASNNATQPIQIGISFRNRTGEYCRSFAVQNSQSLAGLACRSRDNWRVQVLTESSSGNSGDFRQANSSMPVSVLTLIEQQISGEALDAQAENVARQSGWK